MILKKSKALLMLLIATFITVISIGFNPTVGQAANTIRDMDYVSKHSAYNTGKMNTSELASKTWKNGDTFSGRYTFTGKGSKINGHSGFNVGKFTGTPMGVNISSLTANAGCTIWNAADWPSSAIGKTGTYKGKVYKSGNTVKLVFQLAPPNGLKQATASSGSGYQHSSFYLQFTEAPKYGKVRVIKKDSRGGNVTGSSATFDFYTSDNKLYGTVKTGADGTVTSGNIPVGTYRVVEKNAPVGYATISDQKVTVIENKTVDLTFTNTVKKASVTLQKKPSEDKTGNATLKDAEYTLYAAQDIKDPKDNSLLWSKDSAISSKNGFGTTATQKADANGIIKWSNLPMGDYYTKETKAPYGYELSNEVKTFSVEETSLNKEVNLSVREQNTLKSFYILKEDEAGNPLAKAEFQVKLKSDVEKNGFDKAVNYGTLISDEEGKSNTIELPFGTYVVRETKAPEGYELSSDTKEVTINDSSAETQFVKFSNKREEIKIQTTAIDSKTKDHSSVVEKKTTFIDTVSYTNLIRGKEYTVKGKLMDQKTGKVLTDADGKEITGETTFTATERNGTVDVVFTFDASLHKGKTTVVFEDLYEEGILMTSHADIEDEGQTVDIPDLKTTATSNDKKSVLPNKETIINDVVEYKNLIVGKEYTVKGKLMDQKTGKVLKDADGKDITSETTFTAKEKNGKVTVTFKFDSSHLATGKTTVVFEDLYQDDLLIISHADINDKDQTVEINPVLTDIQVNKVDKMTNQVIKSKKFEFTMYSDKECTKVVMKANADESKGTATFKDVEYGTYYIKETKAPTGYELSNEVKKVVLNENTEGIGDVHSFVYYNTPLPASGVKTGDKTNISTYIIASIISFAFFVGYFILKMKNQGN